MAKQDQIGKQFMTPPVIGGFGIAPALAVVTLLRGLAALFKHSKKTGKL